MPLPAPPRCWALWSRPQKQTYMAVGLTMMAAAELGVEATPLEGFDPASAGKAFKIRKTGHTTTVLLALGYPDPNKQYSNPISRFDADQLFTFVWTLTAPGRPPFRTWPAAAQAPQFGLDSPNETPFTAWNGLISP